MINALIVFIIMYAGMLLLPKWRLYFAIGGAAAMILLGILTPLSAIKAINLNQRHILVLGNLFNIPLSYLADYR